MTPQVLLIYGLASLAVLAACVLIRLAYGAPITHLVRTRAYEIPPLRLLFHTLHIVAWACAIVSGLNVLRYTFGSFGSGGTYLRTALAFTAATAVFAGLVVLVRRKLINLPKNPPPFVSVTDVDVEHGIDRDHLATLGQEQFPHCLAYDLTAGLWVRRGLMIFSFGVVALLLVSATDWGRDSGLQRAGLSLVKAFRLAPASPSPPTWVFVVGISSGLALILLLVENTSYTLMTFPKTVVATALLVVGVWWSLAKFGATDVGLGQAAGFLGLVCGLRWAHDLRRARRFKRARQVSQPIAAKIATTVPPLAALKARPDCKLPVPDCGDLSARITRGCRNVEEASPLVLRNLARFLALVKVEYEQFAAAMLRFLTVRRFVTSSGGAGTYRFYQNPVVPMWNETLFPLHPPTGYQNWLDPLPLGSEWDIVTVCPTCGGSGTVTRTETYTETENGQSVTRSRQVTETCSQCGGSGRVLYQQTLNTQWQRLFPTCTDPHVQVPEFMEDAEERTYYRVPFVENRTTIAPRPMDDGRIGNDLKALLRAAADKLGAELPEFTAMVEKLHDGILYRADFQVTGFWTTRINFRRLPGKVGWFFGARPEFHFPALPVAWGAVASVTFVLPFLVLTVLLLAAGVQNWLNAVLPTMK